MGYFTTHITPFNLLITPFWAILGTFWAIFWNVVLYSKTMGQKSPYK
jgi:hypothetical protein